MPLQQISDVSIYYEETDFTPPWRSATSALLFIHGLNSSHQHWFHQVRFFAGHYPVVTIDLRGHGESSKPSQGYSVDHYTADVVQLLDKLGIKRVNVVGGSLGGCIAQQLAAMIPAKVASIALVGSTAESPKELDMSVFLPMIKELGIEGFFREFLQKDSFSPDVDPGLVEFTLRVALSSPADIIMQRTREGLIYDGLEAARTITCPALIVVGENDNTTPRHYSEKMRELIKDSSLAIIPNCGHLPHLEVPDLFNNLLLRFLEGVERRAGQP
jgi:pimeloyl-ACP methyl ester carboxylesterase